VINHVLFKNKLFYGHSSDSMRKQTLFLAQQYSWCTLFCGSHDL